MNENEFDIDKAYVSPYDEFLKKFDREHALTESQLKEIKTYQRINALRDGTGPDVGPEKIWEEF
jgi:hypothetical protein